MVLQDSITSSPVTSIVKSTTRYDSQNAEYMQENNGMTYFVLFCVRDVKP